MKKKCFIFILIIFLSIFASIQNISAENAKVVEDIQTYLFAVPEGGWSSAKLHIRYYEYCSNANGYMIMNRRRKWISAKLLYATERPKVTFGNVEHSNGKVFSSWDCLSVMYDPTQWDYSELYENTEKVSYKRPGNFEGKFYYTISCYGGIPLYYIENVRLAFSFK